MIEQKGHMTILKTGPGSSIQDLGRKMWTHFGVPSSGPMDRISFSWVNHILRNDPGDAVLEISQPGLKLEFSSSCEIAMAGAQANLLLNDTPIFNLKKISISAKSILEIGQMEIGAKIYLAIKQGFQTPLLLGSRSFFQEITEKSYLQKGDQIPYLKSFPSDESGNSNPKWDPSWYQKESLDFFPGPDYKLLSPQSKEKLINEEFTLSPFSSRMGTLLLEPIENELPELPTNPVYPGTVQLTSGGKLIVLGQDAQVTGGYPRIMYLTEFSQSILAQKKAGQKVRFNKKQATDLSFGG
jgi:biotin-dependent carboxylase-like uncharacterized protein